MSAHLLQLGIGSHAGLLVAGGQLKHAVVEAVESRQRHKLVLVAHCAQLLHIMPTQANPQHRANDDGNKEKTTLEWEWERANVKA